MTQKTTLPGTFSGPLVDALPKFKPGTPVPQGLVRRYMASELEPAAVGKAVPRLTEMSGAGPALTQSVTAKQPTLRQAGGIRYLEFDGVDDALAAPGDIPGPVTFAVLARYRAATAPNWPVLTLRTNLNGMFSLNTSGTMTAYAGNALNAPGSPGAGWHVFLATFNGADSVARMDGGEATGNTGPMLDSNSIMLGTGAASGVFVQLDVAEVLVWNRALSASERAKVATDLRSAYAL